jgi:energy-coupling factor transporter ATP-binding protein EcfA2
MDLSGRPLLDTKPDQALFAGRDAELNRLLTSVDRGLNVLLLGERGSGKTTLLRRLAYELRQKSPDAAPAFVEGALAEDVRIFIDLIRYRLGLSPTVVGPTPFEASLRAWSARKVPLEDTLALSKQVASLREAAPDGDRRCVLVDELPSPTIAQTLFGRLRDELWQLPLTWVVAVPESAATALLSPPADAFFDVVVRLEPLSPDAQRAILKARAGPQGKQIARQIDEGNPRRLLALAREALEEGVDPSDLLRALARRDAEVSKLGRSASMLMSELESLGGASASDERLLKRLGWTRSRAVQVLRELEEAGFVTSSTAKGEPGRPRKIYRPVDPETHLRTEDADE